MRRSRVGEKQVLFPKSLQVLWTDEHLNRYLTKDLGIIKSPLLSLKYNSIPSSLKPDLRRASKTLKHLSLSIAPHRTQGSSSRLHFPNLQILELGRQISVFPSWMTVPSNLKVFTFSIIRGLPSISELYIKSVEGFQNLKSNCPELEVLRFDGLDTKEPTSLTRLAKERLLHLMRARMRDVEDGVEWQGIKTKKLKKLIISFRNLNVEMIDALRSLTEELVDNREPKYPIIELEV